MVPVCVYDLADGGSIPVDPTNCLGEFWIIFAFSLLCLSIAGGDSCPPGYYYSTAEDTHQCVACSVCGAGQGTSLPCGGSNDTVCSDCPHNHYSTHTSSGRACVKCKNCAPRRVEASPCTATQDRVCGRCSQGYFLYVTSDTSECLPCSQCPVNQTVLHWLDCAAAGEPDDNQCAPGSRVGDYTTTTARPTVHPTSTKTVAGKTKLPTNHGMFVTMNGLDAQSNELPTNAITEKEIAIISIAFTVAALLACVLAMTCLFWSHCHCCGCCKRGKQRKIWTFSRRKKTHYPVQVEDNSESTYHPRIS